MSTICNRASKNLYLNHKKQLGVYQSASHVIIASQLGIGAHAPAINSNVGV